VSAALPGVTGEPRTAARTVVRVAYLQHALASDAERHDACHAGGTGIPLRPTASDGRPRVIYCPPGIYGMGIQITDCHAEGSHFGISDWGGRAAVRQRAEQ
jgi:hypothetical protein